MSRLAICLVLCAACRLHFDDDRDAAADSAPACTAVAVPASGRVSGQLATSTTDDHGSCGGEGFAESSYFIDVPPGAQLLATDDELNTVADTLLYVRTTCDDPASEVLCDDMGGRGDYAAYRMLAPAPGRYYVFLDGQGEGAYDSRIVALLPQGAACDPALGRSVCGAGLACVNNQCDIAACPIADILQTGATTYMRTAVTSTAPSVYAGSCGESHDGGLRSGEIIYQLVLISSVANVNVTTASTNTDYDTLIYMRSSSCAGPELKCDDDGVGGAGASMFDTGPLAAGDYFIFIDGFAGRSGTAEMTVTITP